MRGYAFGADQLDGHTVRYRLTRDGAPVSWAETVTELAGGGELPDTLTRVLAAAPWPGCFWECPPVAADTAAAPFEMVLVEAAALDRVGVDQSAFASQLGPVGSLARDPVGSFANLGGDARLVVPAPWPGTPAAAYAHLVRFCRLAGTEQTGALWREVSAQLTAWWSSRPAPVWLSTSGLGVAWLHVRLDSRPKYYTHAPYRLPAEVR